MRYRVLVGAVRLRASQRAMAKPGTSSPRHDLPRNTLRLSGLPKIGSEYISGADRGFCPSTVFPHGTESGFRGLMQRGRVRTTPRREASVVLVNLKRRSLRTPWPAALFFRIPKQGIADQARRAVDGESETDAPEGLTSAAGPRPAVSGQSADGPHSDAAQVDFQRGKASPVLQAAAWLVGRVLLPC